MKSPWISALRSVALTVPDLVAAETFYTRTWNLDVVDRSDQVLYLGGSGADHHLLALHQASGAAQILKVSLRARDVESMQAISRATIAAGGTVEHTQSAANDPAAGQSIIIRDPHGRRFEIVHDDRLRDTKGATPADRPIRLAHVVLNSHDIASSQRFIEQALGFVLADRTRIMAFLNCNNDHHSLALGDADNDALNHIAFLMPSLDCVMRGGGRMKDAGHAIQWGPGRHGPGDNTFNYFIDPFGVVIEYTAEVEQIDDSYRVGGPQDWAWPAGRFDHWGISVAPTRPLKEAQRKVRFAISA